MKRHSWIVLAAVFFSTSCKRNESPESDASSGAPTAKARIADRPSTEASNRRNRSSTRSAADKWHSELLAKFPELHVELDDVPPDQNGYFQLIELAEELQAAGGIPEWDQMRGMLTGEEAWDQEFVGDWFDRHAEILHRLFRLAALPERSSSGISSAFGASLSTMANIVCQLGEVLVAYGRLQHEAGDQDSSRAAIAAAEQLSDHIGGVEEPSLLGATVAARIHDRNWEMFYEHMLPSIAGDRESLLAWREVMQRTEDPLSALQRIVIGEWNSSTREIVLPAFLGSEGVTSLRHVPDQDVMLEVYAGRAISVLNEIERSNSLANIAMPEYPPSEHLSPEARRLLEQPDPWSFALTVIRSQASRNAMHDSVLAVMLGEHPGLEPTTGDPFVWDDEGRVLSPPQSIKGFVLEPLDLP